MDDFVGKNLLGEWYRPEKPCEKWTGALRFDADHGGTLEIQIGKGSDTPFNIDGSTIDVLHGVLQNHYGYKVSLFNVLPLAKEVFGDGTADEQVRCATNHVLMGGFFESEDKATVCAVQMRLTGLTDWCDQSYFGGEVAPHPKDARRRKGQITYESPPPREISLSGGKRLRFTSRYEGPMFFNGKKKILVNEIDHIEVLFGEPLSINAVMSEVLVWQTFLGFALRRASYIQKIRLKMAGDSEGQFPYLLFVPGSKASDPPPVPRRDALFFRSNLGEEVERILVRWNTLYEEAETAIQLFSSVDYQGDIYFPTSLLIYLQALEVLHRDLYPGSTRFPTTELKDKTLDALRAALPAELENSLRDELSKGLGYVGQVSLLQRYLAFYDRCPASLKDLFPNRSEDMKLLKNVRNYLTHYGDTSGFDESMFRSRRVVLLKEKARFFMEIALLDSLGLKDGNIHALLDNCRPYQWLASETH